MLAEVVPYGSRLRPYWVGWIRGSERVRGRFATRDQAQMAVESAIRVESTVT
jgi:hypothetical protein